MLMEQWIRISNRILKPMWLVLCIDGICFQGVNAQEVLVELPPQRQATTQGENIYLQNLKKNIQFDKNEMMLGKALRYIANHAELKLSYSEELIPLDKKVAIEQGDMTVEQALRMILDGTTLRFGISSTGQLFFLEKQVTRAEEALQVTVSGMVTDAQNGEALPGVNVIVVGSEEEMGSIIGTQTDINGSYSVNVPDALNTLAFTYIGYQRLEVDIDGRSEIDIQLQQDIQMLDDVVVVGYGTQRLRDVTGAISTVNSERLSSMPVPSVSDAIQGKAPGVQVVSTGTPGSDASFRIRGTGTIGNSNPLIVIDGFPTRSGLNQLNTHDIESIQVLKDASASAIYGAQGANGVIIVTTKRGGDGQGSLSIDVSTSVQQPAGTIDMLNASQFASLHNEMMINNGQERNPAFSNPAELGKGTDWLGEMFHPAIMQDHTVSYSWGDENTSIYASGGFLRQNGTIIETAFNRYTLQFNSDVRVLDNLKFGNNLTLSHDEKPSGSYNISNAMAALPTQSVFNPDGTYAGPVGFPAFVGDVTNPVGQARLIENNTKGYNIIGSVFG